MEDKSGLYIVAIVGVVAVVALVVLLSGGNRAAVAAPTAAAGDATGEAMAALGYGISITSTETERSVYLNGVPIKCQVCRVTGYQSNSVAICNWIDVNCYE